MLCLMFIQDATYIHIIHIIFDYKTIIYKHACKSNIICICNISIVSQPDFLFGFSVHSSHFIYIHCICIDIDFTYYFLSSYVNHTLIHCDWIVHASWKNSKIIGEG